MDYMDLLQQQVDKNQADVLKEAEPAVATPPPQRPLPSLCCVPSRLVVSPSLGGKPISTEQSQGLRRALFGASFHVFTVDWRRAAFRFRDRSYALHIDPGGAGAVQMFVQAEILRLLLFPEEQQSASIHSLMDLEPQTQDQVLASALVSGLWSAGDRVRTMVALFTEEYCTTPSLDYKLDHFTEKLQLFTFSDRDDLKEFILQHLSSFTEEGSHGLVLFLYSLLCSRTLPRLREDLQSPSEHLLQLRNGTYVCRQSLLNLLLTGRACPHVFNGTQSEGERPLQGITDRSEVGFLHWSQDQRLPPVGSRLRTPLFPVWLCRVNRTFLVLFGLDRSLLWDWRTEHLFQLYVCRGDGAPTRITVDTRSHQWEAPCSDPEKNNSLEMTLRTKWTGAVVHWNGSEPF